MFYLDQVAEALATKRSSFTRQESAFQSTLAAYRRVLSALPQRAATAAALQDLLLAQPGAHGAQPLPAYDTWAARTPSAGDLPIQPFGRAFAHHEAARSWAEAAITGMTTAAVDGSQIQPWQDAPVPVGLVQAGIFVNPHDAARPYRKVVEIEVLAPDELAPLTVGDDDGVTPEALVNLRRFELEARVLANWMREVAGTPQPGGPVPPGGPMPPAGPMPPGGPVSTETALAILDGSLIVSFALKMHPVLRAAYVLAVRDLLEASESSRVPLIAYIDSSRARDLISLARALAPELPESRRLHDAHLWGASMAWGDCAVPWLSARGDVLEQYGAQRDAIAFTYLRATADRPPARVEMPAWVARDSALFGRVMDILRAEIIVGNGYPYAIETADALAVISVADRERFAQLFAHFAAESGWQVTMPTRKAVSKLQRR